MRVTSQMIFPFSDESRGEILKFQRRCISVPSISRNLFEIVWNCTPRELKKGNLNLNEYAAEIQLRFLAVEDTVPTVFIVYKSGVSPSSYLSQCLHIEHFPGCNPGLMGSGLLGSSVFLMTTSFNSILFWNHDNWTSFPTISDVELSLWPKRIPVQLMLLKSHY